MSQKQRLQLENFLIFLLAVLSVCLFALSLLPAAKFHNAAADAQAAFEMGRMAQRALSITLLFVCMQLKKRKQAALWIALFLFALNFLRCLVSPHTPVRFLLMGGDLFFFLTFFCLRKDFCCPASRRSGKQAITVLFLSLIGICANAGIGYHYLKSAMLPGRQRLLESITESFAVLFGQGGTLQLSHSAHLASLFLFWFSWACIFASIAYAVQPWILSRRNSSEDIQHARTLLNLYGQNNCSYLALEADKSLYFGQKADGVIPYGTVGDVVVVNGDPVCADADFPVLLAEFKEFCERSAHKLIFLSVTERYLDIYQKQGFGTAKCGEEARFLLSEYEISGKKGAKMRMNINHAKKAGVTVEEYKPLLKRDASIEEAFSRISTEWLADKKSSLLQFTMGTVGLENPMDKRYFYAKMPDGSITAFIVFVPFSGKQGYMADVTRHGNAAPGGVMETIIYDAFMQFKQEGVLYGSLGVAPLAGLETQNASLTERMLHFVYEHLNSCYGFRDLYRAKEKYSPTVWLPAYYVFLPKHPTLDLFYAVVKIQNPDAIREGIHAILHRQKQPLQKLTQKREAAK